MFSVIKSAVASQPEFVLSLSAKELALLICLLDLNVFENFADLSDVVREMELIAAKLLERLSALIVPLQVTPADSLPLKLVQDARYD